jgi:hypothetical protein
MREMIERGNLYIAQDHGHEPVLGVVLEPYRGPALLAGDHPVDTTCKFSSISSIAFFRWLLESTEISFENITRVKAQCRSIFIEQWPSVFWPYLTEIVLLEREARAPCLHQCVE